jgi:hypothetical protein
MKLAALKASSLRGIPRDWPEIQIGDKGLIVYGPNGVGKSSLIDAIEWILKGVSTLYAENRVGVNWAAAAPHIRGGPYSISLTVKGDQGRLYCITTAGACPPEAAGWTSIASSSNFVLRRHMLLRFIDTRPQQRYEQIEAFF